MTVPSVWRNELHENVNYLQILNGGAVLHNLIPLGKYSLALRPPECLTQYSNTTPPSIEDFMGDTKEEIAAREAYVRKHWREKDRIIAETLGLHISSVQRIRRRLGLHKRESAPKTHYERSERRYDVPYKELAQEFAKLCNYDQKVMRYFVSRSAKARREMLQKEDI